MNLVKLSVSRHVLAASLSIAIVFLGLLAYTRLGISRYPDVEFPVLSVTTSLPGAPPQTVARTLTQPLESRLNSIAGIHTLTSSSISGMSVINATFEIGTDLRQASVEVQSRLAAIRGELPSEAGPLIVHKFAMNSSPILWMTLHGTKSPLELSTLAKTIQERVEAVTGVGEVRLVGAAQRTLHVTVNDARLNALNLTYADIEREFQRNHVTMAGGRLRTAGREYQIDLPFEYTSPQQLSELAIMQIGERVVRLGELAELDEFSADTRELARYNGHAAVAIGVVKGTGSDAIDVIDRVRHRVEHELAKVLPPDVSLNIVTDEKKPVQSIIQALHGHLVEGVLLTGMVVWLFLKSGRAATIIFSAIPVSLLGAIAALYLFGYSLNSFTMLALLLLVGVVVDDAIVVLENIHRTRDETRGLDLKTAAENGAREVQSAVMAATLTLVCVFGSVIIIPGIVGQFLRSFAVTVVVGILVSWLVSMTLVPMLCTRFLKPWKMSENAKLKRRNNFQQVQYRYAQILAFCLRHRLTVLAIAVATLVPAWLLLGTIKTEFTPPADEGRITIQLSLPSGHGKEKLQELAAAAESRLAAFDGWSSVLTTFEDRSRDQIQALSLQIVLDEQQVVPQKAIVERLHQAFSEVPGWRATVLPAGGTGSTAKAGAPLQFHVQGPDYHRLQQLAQDMHTRITALPGMHNLHSHAGVVLPQLTATVDTAEVSRLGVSMQAVSRAVAAFNGALTLGRYTASDGERYDIVLRSGSGISPPSTDVLGHIKVRTRSGNLVPLSTFVQFKTEGVSASLQRINQQYAVSFFGHPQMALGEALAHVREAADQLPPGYFISFSGQSEEMRSAGQTVATVFAGALALLYLVLASQFNSFVQPLLIMLALPLALIGGFGALAATEQTLNVYSMIGLLMLMGLVVKNSILLVDKANQLVAQGMAVHNALQQACSARLRPVLMTSLTVMLAMAPAAAGLGIHTQAGQPLSIVILGGMASSTLLTLVVVPAAYALFMRSAPASETDTASAESALILKELKPPATHKAA